MDNKVNYTIVGGFVIALLAALILIIMWLTSMKHDEVYNIYITNVREEVSGLSVQSPVRYNGVKVGYVSSLKLNPNDPQQVKIVMKIVEGTPITTSTIATLMSEGITGIAFIGLKALTAEAPILKARPGELYPVIPSEPSLLMKISTAVQEVTESISALSKDVRQVFDDKNRMNLSRSLANIEKITHTLAINSAEINQSLKSANSLLSDASKASKQLPGIMTQVNNTLTELNKTARSVTKAGNSVTEAMGETQVSLQGLSQQVLPSASQLLQRLNNLSGSLVKVTSEMSQNPAIIIRGKAPAKLGPGEK